MPRLQLPILGWHFLSTIVLMYSLQNGIKIFEIGINKKYCILAAKIHFISSVQRMKNKIKGLQNDFLSHSNFYFKTIVIEYNNLNYIVIFSQNFKYNNSLLKLCYKNFHYFWLIIMSSRVASSCKNETETYLKKRPK